ncbi:MAG TPA: RidA family protein [Casimicrobiaceae bacterium]|nr:RidA family protein [Casimicrobiaceae bacterium]
MSAHPLFHMIDGAPDPVAPFSHAVEADGWVFLTGQMPFTGTSNTSPYPDTIEDQTHQVMQNLATVLQGCRLELADVVSVRVFLRDFDADYATMNGVYAGYFAPGRLPARTCVGVSGLARGARIEIDMIARRPACRGSKASPAESAKFATGDGASNGPQD